MSIVFKLLKALHDADVEDFQRRGRVNRAVQRKGERDRLLQERGKVLRKVKVRKQSSISIGQMSRVTSLGDLTGLSDLDLYCLPRGKRRRH